MNFDYGILKMITLFGGGGSAPQGKKFSFVVLNHNKILLKDYVILCVAPFTVIDL